VKAFEEPILYHLVFRKETEMTALLEEKTRVQEFIEGRLDVFDEVIETHKYLEIDGDIENDDPEFHVLKIINHNTRLAHSVSLNTIIRQRPEAIIKALETGVTIRLQGITRIVGYYSRTHNWNRSKKVELADRHKGSYKLSECEGL
jgi:hypothetical protein